MSILPWILWAVLSTTESSTINSTSLPPPQQLTVLNLNFWGLGWPWGSDKDVRLYQNLTTPVSHSSTWSFQDPGAQRRAREWEIWHCVVTGNNPYYRIRKIWIRSILNSRRNEPAVWISCFILDWDLMYVCEWDIGCSKLRRCYFFLFLQYNVLKANNYYYYCQLLLLFFCCLNQAAFCWASWNGQNEHFIQLKCEEN